MKDYLFTSESVTEGHPDKICDLISDTILDECLKQDCKSRVAVETLVSKDLITIAGQITTNAKIEIDGIARGVLQKIGYNESEIGIDYRTCKITQNITRQSSDIATGVENGGAGDQGIIFGYACDETQNYMPYAIERAHQLSKRLSKVRKERNFKFFKARWKNTSDCKI